MIGWMAEGGRGWWESRVKLEERIVKSLIWLNLKEKFRQWRTHGNWVWDGHARIKRHIQKHVPDVCSLCFNEKSGASLMIKVWHSCKKVAVPSNNPWHNNGANNMRNPTLRNIPNSFRKTARKDETGPVFMSTQLLFLAHLLSHSPPDVPAFVFILAVYCSVFVRSQLNLHPADRQSVRQSDGGWTTESSQSLSSHSGRTRWLASSGCGERKQIKIICMEKSLKTSLRMYQSQWAGY